MADYWAKVYIEIIDDPKMATMPDRLWRRTVELFLLGKKFNQGGHLPDTKQLAWVLRMTTDELDLDMKQISLTGIIRPEPTGWFIVNFEKRQAASSSTERSHQFRKRTQSNQYYNNDETQLQRNVAQINREQRTDNREQSIEGAALSSGYIPPSQEERIYCAVTRYPTIPSGDIDSVLDRIAKIKVSKGCDDNELIVYLRPFFVEQEKRYPGDSRSPRGGRGL